MGLPRKHGEGFSPLYSALLIVTGGVMREMIESVFAPL